MRRRRIRSTAGAVSDEQTVVLDERPAVLPPSPVPPPEGPPPPPDRELWPWLLALLVLVLVGLGAAYLLTRKDDTRSTHPTATVTVITQTATTTTATGAAGPRPVKKTSPPAKNPAAAPAAPARIAVTNVLGISAADASTRLQHDGFTTRLEPVFSSKPRGIVAAQNPRPGTKTAKGTIVVLQTSKGPRPVVVPSVTGQDQQQALETLKHLGLRARLIAVPSIKPVGIVVAQRPRPGEKVPGGTAVRLNIAKVAPKRSQTAPPPAPAPPPTAKPQAAPQPQPPAPQPQPTPTQTSATTTQPSPPPPPPPAQKAPPPPTPVSVPEVTGLKLRVARKKIRAASLITEIKYVPSQEPADTIVAQSPKAGATLKKGAHVLVNVSLGPKPAQQSAVPDIVGQDEKTATDTLQQAGFTVETVEVPVDSADQDAIVQDEEPAAGSNAPTGAQVTVYVGRYTATG